MRRFSIEVAAKSRGITELFVPQNALGPNVAEGSRQLIVVRIAACQTVIVDQNLELALAQRRTVEMGQVIDCRAGSVHGRLVDQMYLTEKGWVARRRTRDLGQAVEERHPRRSMSLEHRGHRIGELVDRAEPRLGVIRFRVCRFAQSSHWKSLPLLFDRRWRRARRQICTTLATDNMTSP
jgi:hypothetical protein